MTKENMNLSESKETLRGNETLDLGQVEMIRELCRAQARKDMNRLLGTSAADCNITIENDLNRDPAEALRTVIRALFHMNNNGIEKKAHRQALVRAGKKALGKIGEP